MKVNYPSNSPYSSTAQSSWYLGRFSWKAIPPDSKDQLITISKKYEYRPDILSYDLYGTPAYWWVFCIRNPYMRKDPIWTMTAGQQIWLPSAEYIRNIIG